jgi:DNA-binding transcriptional LysR family regulator
MQNENWDDLRFVLGVARAQSFGAAARRLGVNESTVVRRVVQLERRLRVSLFDRNRAGVCPTKAGLELVHRAEKIELEVQAAQGSIAGGDERAVGIVRLTSVPAIVNRVLVPQLPGLIAKNPELYIELVAEGHDLSLTKRETDIALRLAQSAKEARVITRKLGKLPYAVYCAKEYARKELKWINYEGSMRDLPQARWIDEFLAKGNEKQSQVLVNDAETLLQCVKHGLGKSFLPTIIGDREPDLARVPEYSTGEFTRDLWLLAHPELRHLLRIRVVIDWLIVVCKELSSHK